MKHVLVMIIGVGVFVIPTMATVNFSATDAGNGKLRIGYTTTDGELPGGVTLWIHCTDSEVDLEATAAAKSWDSAFNYFPDYFYSNPLSYRIGDGHPLANPYQTGALTADPSVFSINMEADQSSGLRDGPPSTMNLITIQLKMGPAVQTIVMISGDTFRGPASGVVGRMSETMDRAILNSNLPITVQLGGCALECLKCTAPEYSDWVAWGKPACWCFTYQCRGDADGRSSLGKPVSLADLNILKAAFNKTDAELRTIPDGICADFDHNSRLGKRVTLVDLNILKIARFVSPVQIPPCDLGNFNFWLSP